MSMRPIGWFGAPSTGGLTLPAAMPTANQFYAPRGVWLDDQRLIVADTGNHRVLIWHDITSMHTGDFNNDHSDADVGLGQPDFCTEGAQGGGTGPATGMRLPTGILVHEGRLVVADAWNHRLLIYNTIPEHNGAVPDLIVGQPDGESVTENRGEGCGPKGFYWPFGLSMADRFYVADTGNRRVLAWDEIPEPDQEPTLVLGQDTPFDREENRGGINARSFRWPHDIAASTTGDDPILYVADAGNHRLLGWKPHPNGDTAATVVHGQSDFQSGAEFPYAPQSNTALRFPYAVSIDKRPGPDGHLMAVADTANNRILVWDGVPTESGVGADHVLGQPDFAANGENRWDQVLPDTFCWPYGISCHNGLLAVADSGNNRVMVWSIA